MQKRKPLLTASQRTLDKAIKNNYIIENNLYGDRQHFCVCFNKFLKYNPEYEDSIDSNGVKLKYDIRKDQLRHVQIVNVSREFELPELVLDKKQEKHLRNILFLRQQGIGYEQHTIQNEMPSFELASSPARLTRSVLSNSRMSMTRLTSDRNNFMTKESLKQKLSGLTEFTE
jgi:hypothetical protein